MLVSRVGQLDAALLDDELQALLSTELFQILKLLKARFVSVVSPPFLLHRLTQDQIYIARPFGPIRARDYRTFTICNVQAVCDSLASHVRVSTAEPRLPKRIPLQTL